MNHSQSLRALVASLLWSELDSSDVSGGEPLDLNYDIDDVDGDCLDKLETRYQAFIEKAEQQLKAKFGGEYSSIEDFYIGSGNGSCQAEHDYIMTVNGHGCGFWEKHDWLPEVGDILTRLAKEEKQISCWVKDETVHIEFG